MQRRGTRWWSLVILAVVVGVVGLSLPSVVQAGGLIPGTNPVFSGQELEVKA